MNILNADLSVTEELLTAAIIGISRARPRTIQRLSLRGMEVSDVSVLVPLFRAPKQLTLSQIEANGHWSRGLDMQKVCITLDGWTLSPQLLVQTLNALPKAARPTCLDFGKRILSSKEISRRWEPMEVTTSLLELIELGHLEKLCFVPYQFDLGTVCSALYHDRTLQRLESQYRRGSPEQEQRAAEQLLVLMQVNTTLEELIVYDFAKKTDYTGYTNCRKEMNGPIRSSARIYGEAPAERTVHYMRMNRCGRKKLRHESTCLEEIVGLLGSIHDRMKCGDDKESETEKACWF